MTWGVCMSKDKHTKANRIKIQVSERGTKIRRHRMACYETSPCKFKLVGNLFIQVNIFVSV